MDDGTHDFIFSSMWAIGGTLWTISFLILAFSQEQYEDERIRSIRMNTLGIVAIIYGAMIFLYPVMDFACLRLTNGMTSRSFSFSIKLATRSWRRFLRSRTCMPDV